MEPVFMALSQSAAISAGLALEKNVSVQDVPYPVLLEKLEAAKQIARPEAWKRAPAAEKPATGEAKPAPKKAEVFEVEGNKAYLYDAPQPAKGKPWIWYAPVVRGDVIIVKHKAYYDAFMQEGIAVAGFDLGEVRGAPGSTAKFTKFYDAMVQRGYSSKPILLGQSRGGMMTLAWAFRNPDKVKAWAGIYPVCNLTSWPMKFSKQDTLADFAMSEEAFASKLSELNPIDNLSGLAQRKVPMFSVHGGKDGTVPYDDNTKLLKERYEAAGGAFGVNIIPGGGHEVTPAFFECRELIDFVLKHSQP
jgi:predicted esterase